jgi:hypothetical protein
MSLRDAYQQKLQARLQEHKARLEVIRAQAKRAAAHTKILAYEELSHADVHINEARAKLKSLAQISGTALAELKTGFTKALGDLKSASKRAADHLRASASASAPAAQPAVHTEGEAPGFIAAKPVRRPAKSAHRAVKHRVRTPAKAPARAKKRPTGRHPVARRGGR